MYSLLTLQTGLSEFKSSSVKIVKADFCHFLKHSLQFSQLNSSNKHDFFLIRQRKVSYICLYSQIRTYINFQYKYIFNMCFHNILLSFLQRGVKFSQFCSLYLPEVLRRVPRVAPPRQRPNVFINFYFISIILLPVLAIHGGHVVRNVSLGLPILFPSLGCLVINANNIQNIISSCETNEDMSLWVTLSIYI